MLNVIYAECNKKPFMLSVVMLSVVMLSVIILNVVVPNLHMSGQNQLARLVCKLQL